MASYINEKTHKAVEKWILNTSKEIEISIVFFYVIRIKKRKTIWYKKFGCLKILRWIPMVLKKTLQNDLYVKETDLSFQRRKIFFAKRSKIYIKFFFKKIEYFSKEMAKCLTILFLLKKSYSVLLTMCFILKLEQYKRFKDYPKFKTVYNNPSHRWQDCTTFPNLLTLETILHNHKQIGTYSLVE